MNVETPPSADVVVVGGGIIGTAIAYFLAAETEVSVCLLEKDAVAAGSTGDSSAILRHHYGTNRIYTQMALWSHEFYRAFENRIGEPLSYANNAMVRFAADETPAADFAKGGHKTLSKFDVPVTWINHEEFENRYPLLNLDEFDFGVSDDTAGYSDGTDAASGFARAAQREGATIATGIEVTGFRIQEKGDKHDATGRVTGVETNKGSVDCENVVLAAGPWTGKLAKKIGLDIPITPEREQVLLLEPSEDISPEEELPTVSLPGADWYLRPDFGDSVLIATHHSGNDCDPDAYRDSVDESTILRLTDQLSDVVPALVDAEIKGNYCGVYSTTPDNDFILDQAGPKGCYLACGFSGHGFKHGPVVGQILADLVVTGDTDLVDIDQFSLSRFQEDLDGNNTSSAESEY